MTKNLVMFLMLFTVSAVGAAFGQTTEFTYQGKLNDTGGQAAAYDFEFRLCASEAASCSPPLATSVRPNVPVSSGGIFTVKLDFGAANFDGADKFLEIAVRRTGGTTYTTLAPRQKLTSAPYAIQSVKANDALNLGGTAANQYVLTTDSRLDANNYVQNGTTAQPSVSFNISGTGTAGVFNAATQFNLGGERILSAAGTDNLFAGRNSGASNAGISNSFFGNNSGRVNTGNNNSFFGFGAGEINSNGISNSFFGGGAGASNTGGRLNSFFGAGAGVSNTQGDNNAFFGVNAGVTNTTGGNNTIIGTNANVGANNLTNAAAIGTRAFVTQSNSLVLGSINGTNGASVDTNVGIGTTAPVFKLQIVDSSNTGLRVQTSAAGGTVASFGGNGAFQVDAVNVPGGRLNILENGNVGIGNASPTAKLEVTGNGTSSTALEINNGAIKVTGAGLDTQTAVFIVERTAANTCGNWTVLDNPYSNNDPNAILFVTGVVPERVPQTITLAVYYETNFAACPQFNNKWAVSSSYGGNGTPRFNVMIIKR